VRTDRLAREWTVQIVVRAFPLHPDTPNEGLALKEYFAGRGWDLDKLHAQMKARMEAEGLEYPKRTHTFNSRRAQELAKWAETKGNRAIHDALFRAYFVEGKNLATIDVLVDVARSVGLDGEEARRAIEDGAFADAVDEDWKRARAMGVSGVPTYVAAKRGLVGAQPYEVLEHFVKLVGAERRVQPAS
jgi:predicted DsbA family dithiol-disulfide isomerase